MKTPKILMMALVASLCMATLSCDKDDDDTTGYASEVAGSYTGTLDMEVSGRAMGSIEGTLKLASTSSSTISITTPAVESESHMGLPEMTIDGIKVNKAGEGYTLTKDDINITLEGTNYTGSLNGEVKGKELNLTYSVKPGAMPMSIDLTFSGTKE